MSWQLSAASRLLRWTVRPMLARSKGWVWPGRFLTIGAKLVSRRVKGVETKRSANGYWITPQGHGRGMVLYLHGGAYLVGGPAEYRSLVSTLAQRSGCRAYVPRYTLAWRRPAPAALYDAVAAWDALIAQGHDPADIVIGGDSAGGGLALALLAHVLDRGERPAGLFTFSPWTDLTLSGASHRSNAQQEAVLPPERVEEVRDVVRGDLAADDPRVSPLFADFPNPPPVFVAYSEAEVLRDDSTRMIDALRAQGAEIETDVNQTAPHVWHLFQGWVPEADVSLNKAAAFIRRRLPSAPSNGS